MDWSKERTSENYCGYCIGSPPDANCDGSCFTRKDYSPEQIRANRITHLISELRKLPLKRKQLDDREDELISELENYDAEE